MARKIFTDDQAYEMIDAYNKGLTLREVAERFYCSWTTVQNYLNRYGAKIRPKSTPRYPIHMIMTDWNADIKVDRIARVYGFPSRNAVYQFIDRNRYHGFVSRKG